MKILEVIILTPLYIMMSIFGCYVCYLLIGAIKGATGGYNGVKNVAEKQVYNKYVK